MYWESSPGCVARPHKGQRVGNPAACLALQLRRLCLRGGCSPLSMSHPELPHQLSTLTGLEALQVRAQLLSVHQAGCERHAVACLDMCIAFVHRHGCA
jgi:hypothetical protein